jgi:hypothetical protein
LFDGEQPLEEDYPQVSQKSSIEEDFEERLDKKYQNQMPDPAGES